MKSVPKLIRRFVGVLLISVLLLLLLNILVLIVVGSSQTSSGSPYQAADEIGSALRKTEDSYVLDAAHLQMLEQEDAWAMLIDNQTHTVVWHTPNLPEGIPLVYSLSDVSDLTLGYLQDHPTYVGDARDGIVVLGYPQTRYWKSMWPTWDYGFIARLPQTVLMALLCNLILVFLIYMAVTGGLIRSIQPIIAGIKSLTEKDKISVREKGVLSELAWSINRTAETLQHQERLLAKKETARANWIAGVSHDIRTPLSVVMGYAGQLESDARLPEDCRQKAAVIVRQSERMRDLINDLNLASKLEYNMQPLHIQPMNVVSAVRQVAVDFLNLDIAHSHPIVWMTGSGFTSCILNADKDLIQRAVSNLIQNSIRHNETGCTIYVTVKPGCSILISDDGVGVTDAQLQALNEAPHYMVCDEHTDGQRHGLGLLLVKQIAAAHHGSVAIRRSPYGGFETELYLPVSAISA